MSRKMSKQSRKDLLESLQPKYLAAPFEEKTELLNVFIEATGYHRKYAIHLLNGETCTIQPKRRVVRYNDKVKSALIFIWEATDHLCSKRLVPFLPVMLGVLECRGHLNLDLDTRERLLSISASTVDRILKHARSSAPRSYSFTKPGNLLKKQIPVRTFTEWDDAVPGFFEADLVSHSGPDPSGQFLQTLTLTDISTQWTECFALLRRGELEVRMALQERESLLPFPFKGLDTDNGFEFINWNMLTWCQLREITFTRGRPYKKNDQAHVEERNGAIVRRLVGYDRLQGRIAQRTLADFYRVVRLFQNYFQPSQKLQEKHRTGAKLYRKHDVSKTPYQRILESPHVDEAAKSLLTKQFETLDPVMLLQEIRSIQEKLRSISVPSTFPKSKLESRRKAKPSMDAILRIPEIAKEKKTTRQIIQALPPGCVIQPHDFLAYGTRGAVDRCLHKMVKKGELNKVGWGVYRTPGEQQVIVQFVGKKLDEATVSY